MKPYTLLTIVIMLFTASVSALEPISPERLHEIQQTAQKNVAFNLDETQQSFNKTVHGGIQHMLAKSNDNPQLVKAIQAYMLKLANQFRKGDFADTERMHGANMPGLAQLKKASADDIKYEYQALANGAQIHYSTEDTHLLENLHAWFDAQANEHGSAIMPEHTKHHETVAE